MDTQEFISNSDDMRYNAALSDIVNSKILWLLQANEGMFAIMEDDSEKQYIPVWSSEKKAREFATGDWEQYNPEGMSIKEFINWLDELEDDQFMIGAFPDENMKLTPIEPVTFKRHLIEAMEEG
ncbi:MAG: DUF2750 domain-containing protein [Bacteroidota bacterium]